MSDIRDIIRRLEYDAEAQQLLVKAGVALNNLLEGINNKRFSKDELEALADLFECIKSDNRTLNTNIDVINNLFRKLKNGKNCGWDKFIDVLTKEIKIPGLNYYD